MKIFLEDKLFHSVKSYDLVDDDGYVSKIYKPEEKVDVIKLKLERILNSGAILPRKDILSKYSSGNFCQTNFNGDKNISIAVHPSMASKVDANRSTSSSAFDRYQLREISLVLNASLLKRNKLVFKNHMMYLERQVEMPIDTKYIEAISFPSFETLEPFYNKDSDLDFILENYDSTVLTCINLLDMVKGILKKYNLPFPIIDISTGIVYEENEEYREKIKTFIN